MTKIGLWIMVGEPWVTFGALEGSLEGPGSIFNRFWMPFGGPVGHHFQKKVVWAPVLSTYVFGIVPGRTFNG